jgi:hypothetical protein
MLLLTLINLALIYYGTKENQVWGDSPCCSASNSPYRAYRGLSPPSECAISGAQQKTP